MLHPAKVIEALERKRDRFRSAEALAQAELEELDAAVARFEAQSCAEIEAALEGISWPGALPTIEQETQPLIVPFDQTWNNHAEARAWARETLRGVTTFAADGSQISPGRDLSIRVGVVQVGWFENRHVDDGKGDYRKDVEVEVLSPDELAGEESRFADNEVECRRFRGELRQVERFMQDHAGEPERALALVDGSLILSFIQHMMPDRQEKYLKAVERLLDVSEETRVPLVGYVDTSHATDLTSLISHLHDVKQQGLTSDALLLLPRMKRWGERSRLYRCARRDKIVPPEGKRKYYERVLFTYLKTTADNLPARVEMPAWVLDAGRHEWVLNVLRAECIVGTGYPYTLETADAVAVLTAQDRERFLALFQQFAEREGLTLRFSKKAASKRRRRI